jgi:hypothetical protein
MKLFLAHKSVTFAILTAAFATLSAQAQPSCTKKMLKEPTSATDQCLSDQVQALNLKIEKRYAEINAKLPEVSAPATDTQNEGISKARMNDVYDSWKSYQKKACMADAARFDLQKRYENRMYSVCWISAAKQHLAFLR